MKEPKTIKELFAYLLGLEERIEVLEAGWQDGALDGAEPPEQGGELVVLHQEFCPGCGAPKGKCADTCGYERKHRLDPVA